MTLTPQDAAAALADIEQVRTRSAELRNYQAAAPHFYLWALIWLIGYGLGDLAPQLERFAWSALVVFGWLVGVVLTRQANRTVDAARMRAFWGKFWRLAVVVAGFSLAMLAVLRPHGLQQAAFWPLLVAAIYCAVGIYAGRRLLLIGVALAILTLVGFFALTGWFLLWMAVIGSGALLAGGLWLRSA